jgi:hypothetical protein
LHGDGRAYLNAPLLLLHLPRFLTWGRTLRMQLPWRVKISARSRRVLRRAQQFP